MDPTGPSSHEREMPRQAKSLINLSTLIAATASLIMIAIVYGAYLFSERSGALAQTAFDVSFAELRLSRAFNIVLEAESSQRGYLLTHDDSYLGTFNADRQLVREELRRAGEQMAQFDLSDFSPALAQLGQIIDSKLTELDHTVSLARSGRQDEALAIMRANFGRDLMIQARAIVSDELRLLADLRSRKVAAAHVAAQRLALFTTLGVISVVLLSLVGVLRFYSYSAELSEAREKLAAANDALEARVAERTRGLQTANEEIQRYAYIVSHDLRAPLVNIIGFTRELGAATAGIAPLLALPGLRDDDPVVARARLALEEDIPESLKFIEVSTTRMDNLINAILSLSRLGRLPLQPQDIDLEALTLECIASVQHRLNDAGATIAIDGKLPRMIGDPRAMTQILGNLLDNAVKYLVKDRPGRIFVRGRRAGDKVVLEIEDNGRGVAPKDRERIFELFRRAGPQDQPGDGIGLAHVRSLARRLGGEIIVKSDGTAGSRFIVTLPSDLRRAIAEGHLESRDHE